MCSIQYTYKHTPPPLLLKDKSISFHIKRNRHKSELVRGHRRAWPLHQEKKALPTGEEECDEAGFFGHVQLEARATEDVFYHSFWPASPLQEGQELLGFLCLLLVKRQRDKVRWTWQECMSCCKTLSVNRFYDKKMYQNCWLLTLWVRKVLSWCLSSVYIQYRVSSYWPKKMCDKINLIQHPQKTRFMMAESVGFFQTSLNLGLA